WLRLLASREGDHFASVSVGLRGHKVRHNLAVLFHEQGRSAEAEAEWRASLEEAPGFVPAWLGLAEGYLAQARRHEVGGVIGRLEATPQGPMEAEVLRGRVHLARQEFAAARQVLEAVVERQPRAIWPCVLLSHVLLREGKDWTAAEKALRAVLVLDPNHAE